MSCDATAVAVAVAPAEGCDAGLHGGTNHHVVEDRPLTLGPRFRNPDFDVCKHHHGAAPHSHWSEDAVPLCDDVALSLHRYIVTKRCTTLQPFYASKHLGQLTIPPNGSGSSNCDV